MKIWIVGLLGVGAACAAAAQDQANPDGSANALLASKGKMVVAANGARLGSVYRVNGDGSAQLIIDGKLVTIPASTLSNANGKLTTSLSKSEVSELR